MNIAVYGIGGAMGKFLIDAINATKDMHIVFGVDKLYPESTISGIPVYSSCKEITADKPDCIIDFSVRAGIYDFLPYAEEHSIPCVIATTGYDSEEQAYIEKAAEKIAIFKSGNMSLGINLLTKLVKQAADFLGYSADIEIVETHHRRKVDAPSGTALMLANAARSVLPETEFSYGREGASKRKENEIGIHAVRGGTVVGKHEVKFFLNNEIITLTHEAESRALFASGAIVAARFLVNKKVGIYDMNDM